MRENTAPSREDYNDYVLHLYFGFSENPLESCIKRAYLDLARTLHGFSKHKNHERIFKSAVEFLSLMLTDTKNIKSKNNQEEFDTWHFMICNSLCMKYQIDGYEDFSYGQAQKWLNMTMKYIYVFGEDYLPGYQSVYRFCHIPVDNYILEAIYKGGAPKLNQSWSRTNKKDYLKIQEWVREQYPGIPPLSVEFHLWNGVMKANANHPIASL